LAEDIETIYDIPLAIVAQADSSTNKFQYATLLKLGSHYQLVSLSLFFLTAKGKYPRLAQFFKEELSFL
jgi:hypothetical protein